MCPKNYVFNIELKSESRVLMRSESWLLIRLHSLGSLDKSKTNTNKTRNFGHTLPYKALIGFVYMCVYSVKLRNSLEFVHLICLSNPSTHTTLHLDWDEAKLSLNSAGLNASIHFKQGLFS